MNPEKLDKIFSLMKSYDVEYFKHKDFEIKMGIEKEKIQHTEKPKQQSLSKVTPPPQAIPPVDVNIPHHVNEVANLLKLSDEDLVDKLFPEYGQVKVGE